MPLTSPVRGLRVVAETASWSPGTRSKSPLMSVPLPTPDGPVMTRIGVVMRLAALTAQERDELVALPLGQAADGLARRDAAVRQNAIHLHAPILRHREQQVEHLRREQVLGRVQQQPVDLRAARLEVALEARAPRPDLVCPLQSVHSLRKRALWCKPCRLRFGGA